MRRTLLRAALACGCLALAMAARAFVRPRDVVHPTAVAGTPTSELRFAICDAAGEPMPGRLTFVDGAGRQPALFVDTDPASGVLAVRRNVVYSLGPPAVITVPAGLYTVYASRGIEWSLATRTLELEAGKLHAWEPKLVREVDTRGLVSADFHLHTYTHSGHGDSNLPERIVSLAGEGLELAVATDHDHHTDYGPTIAAVGAAAWVTSVVGNEVTTAIGHFNAFPLDPARPVVDSSLLDARELFRRLRAEPNALRVAPIIQVNHPRWDGIDYFAIKGLDPVAGASPDPTFSLDFDTIEVLNENNGWGYAERFETEIPTGDSLHSAVRDWFNLLDHGERCAAVGNSDSHTVHSPFAGYPRNFVAVQGDDASAIDVAALVESVRAKRLFTTTGPLLDFTVGGAAMGSTISARDGRVRVGVRVQAASWIDVDRVKLVVCGDVVDELAVPDRRTGIRLTTEHELALPSDRDTWVCALVEGDDPLAPIVGDAKTPVRPIAIGNPVWIDGDGDGRWTSPWDGAVARARSFAETDSLPGRESPTWRSLVLLALARADGELAARFVPEELAADARRARLAAARAAEAAGVPALRAALESAFDDHRTDAYLGLALMRARVACGEPVARALAGYVERFGSAEAKRYAREVEPLLPRSFVADWSAVGYFALASDEEFLTRELGPESDWSMCFGWTGKDDGNASWELVGANDDGLVSLLGLGGRAAAAAERSIAYAQTYLLSPDDREVVVTLGVDDACRVWLGHEVVHQSTARKSAHPLEQVATVRLRAGPNRVLVKVGNATGKSEFYLRVLDPAVRCVRFPDEADLERMRRDALKERR